MKEEVEVSINEEWAEYVKNNDDWRKQHTKFINAQIRNANKKLKKLSKEKLIKLFNIQNEKVIKKL